MNRQTFLESFGHIVDAPGGIDKLRGMILDLAMKGGLSGPAPGDRAASLGVNEVQQTRRQWTDPTAPPKFSRKDTGFPLSERTLPPSWTYSRLGEILQLVNGRAYKKSEWKTAGIPVIRIQNLNGGQDYYFSDLELRPHSYCEQGDLLFAWSASFGPYIWSGDKAIFHYHIWKVVTSPALVKRFGYYLLQAMTTAVKSASHGLAMLHMTKEMMEGLLCPVPPVAEQHRIVERIEDLMGLCADLEQRQAERIDARLALTASTLRRASEAESVDDLRVAVRAFADNIGLHLAPGDGDLAALKSLRQTIIDLAVRGRLTHQDPEEEPASDLLRRLAAERARLVKAKTIRKPRDLGPLEESNIGEQLPRGWKRARASSFFVASDSGWSPQCLNEAAQAGEWAVLKTSAVSRGVFDADENKKLPPGLEPRPQLEVRPGQFVMIRASGSKNLVGRGAIVTETESHLMLSDKHIRLTFVDPASTRYWAVLNDSTVVQSYYSAESSGTSTMSNVTRERVGSLVLSVPPLAEQQRIADTVERLLGICDELEQQFVAARGFRHDLSASVSAHAASGTSAA